MTFDEAMAQLQALGNEKTRAINAKNGVKNQFGVKMGDLRNLANKIKTDPALAAQLWASGNLDAMLLAVLLMKPKDLLVEDLDRLVSGVEYPLVADWLGTNVVKQNRHKEEVRERWMNSDHDITARLGWSLTTERVCKNPEGLNFGAILDRLETEMAGAPAVVQWTMNFCLGEIGINFPEYRDRAVAIGEKLGIYRDFPCSKGCTSPFVPTWVAEMVRRNGT